MKKGQRVEIHPASDHWMRGDRYGTVTGFGRKREYWTDGGPNIWAVPVIVQLDKSGKKVRFHADTLQEID